jgi:hypothetical protein
MFQLLGWLGHFVGDREGFDAWLLRWVAVITGLLMFFAPLNVPAFLDVSKGTRWTRGQVTCRPGQRRRRRRNFCRTDD